MIRAWVVVLVTVGLFSEKAISECMAPYFAGTWSGTYWYYDTPQTGDVSVVISHNGDSGNCQFLTGATIYTENPATGQLVLNASYGSVVVPGPCANYIWATSQGVPSCTNVMYLEGPVLRGYLKVCTGGGNFVYGEWRATKLTGPIAPFPLACDPPTPCERRPAASIVDVDVRRAENQARHFTRDYHLNLCVGSTRLVVRRADETSFNVRLSRAFDPTCHSFSFEALLQITTSGTQQSIPIRTTAPAFPQPNYWWIERKGAAGLNVPFKLHIPPDAPIGQYDIRVTLNSGSGTSGPRSLVPMAQGGVVVLFNPFSNEDATSIGDDPTDRLEYLARTHGAMATGYWNGVDTTKWDYDQFSAACVDSLLRCLSGLSLADRANPAMVARRLSGAVNSRGDSGVLFGMWPREQAIGESAFDYRNYLDHVYDCPSPPVPGELCGSPFVWTGSDKILSNYAETGASVYFGQCWVFGGLLTSLLRGAGIPARPVSNFRSAHDDPDQPWFNGYDGWIDQVIDLDVAERDRRPTGERVWKYHVWCEAWFSQGSGGRWHVVDGTPQEDFGPGWPTGPAAVGDVFNYTIGARHESLIDAPDYETFFVKTEVAAPVHISMVRGGVVVGTKIDRSDVGRFILTLRPGSGDSNPFDNLIGAYRGANPIQPLDPPGIRVTVELDPVVVGQPLVVTVHVINSMTEPRAGSVSLTVGATEYNGTPLFGVAGESHTFMVGANATTDVAFQIAPGEYEGALFATAGFSALAVLESSAGDVDVASTEFEIRPPPIDVQLLSPLPLFVGDSAELSVSGSNALSIPLTNAKLTVALGRRLAWQGESLFDVPIGTVPAGAEFHLERTLDALAPGPETINVTLVADELAAQSSDLLATVSSDCNGDAVDDALQLAPDCNGNGVPDDCDPDLNGNGVPDDCEIADGSSVDCNRNALPDEVEPDCDGDGVLDECEIQNDPTRDCNHNGIPDDCDIASGTLTDSDGDGAPDECGVTCINFRQHNTFGQGSFVACGNQFTAWARSFNLGTSGVPADRSFIVHKVRFGYNGTWTPGFQIGVTVYLDSDGGEPVSPAVDLVPLATVVTSAGGTGGGTTDVIFPVPPVLPPGSTMVVEIQRPADATRVFRAGMNTGGQTGPTYMRDANCGWDNRYQRLADRGYSANLSLVLTVFGAHTVADAVPRDCDLNGVADGCEADDIDCNGNGTKDSCDIAGATSSDTNGNGIPDECEHCPGDVNSDGTVDLVDLATLLTHFGLPTGAVRTDGDLDRDGDVDLVDLATLLSLFGSTCP